MTTYAEEAPRRSWGRSRRYDDDTRTVRRPRVGARRTVLGAIRQMPAYLRLLAGLMTDSRVALVDKIFVGAAIAYVLSPIDLIPDDIPFLGDVDDIFILVLALQRLIDRAGYHVLRDHWKGDIDDLSRASLREVLLAAAFFLPARIRRRLRVVSRRGALD
ncbi:MAG TPA: DUF1232 domain-containing protein [Gemmatimonadaceae bacterium]|nr:DUF1232 domain-containing protein [Gemmatimonadaceae bacterium]